MSLGILLRNCHNFYLDTPSCVKFMVEICHLSYLQKKRITIDQCIQSATKKYPASLQPFPSSVREGTIRTNIRAPRFGSVKSAVQIRPPRQAKMGLLLERKSYFLCGSEALWMVLKIERTVPAREDHQVHV